MIGTVLNSVHTKDNSDFSRYSISKFQGFQTLLIIGIGADLHGFDSDLAFTSFLLQFLVRTNNLNTSRYLYLIICPTAICLA